MAIYAHKLNTPWDGAMLVRIPSRFILKSLFKKHLRACRVGWLRLLINLPLYINVNQLLLARVQLRMKFFRELGTLCILQTE